MFYSRSCEHAIQALVYLAQQPQGRYCTVEEISQHLVVPRFALGKILQALCKHGLLDSRKGRGGGYRLAVPAPEITLLDVMKLIDGVILLSRCVVGLGQCLDPPACCFSPALTELRERIQKMLAQQTIAELAASRCGSIPMPLTPATP